MSEPTDLDALAKQYLDLWQDQLGGIAKDQKAAEIMAQTMELMNAGRATFAAMTAAAQGQENGEDHDNATGNGPSNQRPTASSRGGAASAAAAHGGSEPDVAEFARRLERFEERLTALEAGSKKSRRKTAKKP